MPGCLGSRAHSLLPPPSGEAPDASVLLQVTMADRAAAERACKDPNPNIDGRKANVNLAYLGAKPRSLQTGESPCFPVLLVAIFSLGICRVEEAAPPLTLLCSRSSSWLSCAPREPSQGSHPPAPSSEVEPLPPAACAGGTGRGGQITRLSAVLTGGRKWVPELELGRTLAQRLLPLSSVGPLLLGVLGFRWRCLGGERKLFTPLD